MQILTDDFSENPWWWRHAAPQPINDGITDTTDVAVIGSGYSGLCCALELAQAGIQVTVFDAGDIGIGASTRNAGFLSGRAGVSKQINLTDMVGSERAAQILTEADEAYAHLQDSIDNAQLECGLTSTGRFVGAHTPKANETLTEKTGEYNIDGKNRYRMVDRDTQRNYVDSNYWYGGMFTDCGGLIHPSLYYQGLLKQCKNAGVRFLSNNRVDAVVGGAEKVIVSQQGSVKAREVVLATNGYTDKVSTWHQRRLIPISSTVVASEELGEDRVRKTLPQMCAVIDTKRVVCFARPTPDGRRILFGGSARFSPLGPRESAIILHKQLSIMFPQLSDIKVTNAWSGYMGFTFDFLPKIGIHDGVHYVVGCNGGCGIVMMSWLGRQLAQKIAGTAKQPSAFEGLAFKTQPFYGGKPWILPIIGNWWRFRDWLELTNARLKSV